MWWKVQGPIIGKPQNVEVMLAATTAVHNYLCHTKDIKYLPGGVIDPFNGNSYWRAGGGNVLQVPCSGLHNHTVNAAQ